jgi:hypothetical protein
MIIKPRHYLWFDHSNIDIVHDPEVMRKPAFHISVTGNLNADH